MRYEEGGSCLQNGKHGVEWVLSLPLSLFLCGWLFFFIYLPSRRPALSPITRPPFCTLVLASPLAASLPHSGADVTSVALSMLPTAPYNAHLYFTLQEGFSCLFLHECCKMFYRGVIVWFNKCPPAAWPRRHIIKSPNSEPSSLAHSKVWGSDPLLEVQSVDHQVFLKYCSLYLQSVNKVRHANPNRMHWVTGVTDKMLPSLIRGECEKKIFIFVRCRFQISFSKKRNKKIKNKSTLGHKKEEWEMEMRWTGVQVGCWKGSYSARHTISRSFCLNILVYEVNSMLVVCVELACWVFH